MGKAAHHYIESKTFNESFGQLNKVIIVTDADINTIYVNQNFENITGFSTDEIIGNNPGKILQGKDTNPETVKYLAEKIRNREPVKAEILNYRKDGTPCWIELDIVPEYDEQGEVIRFISIQTDITKRIQAEQELKEKEKFYRFLTEASSELICLHNTNGTYKYISPASKSLLGYEEGELVGKDPYAFFHPDDFQLVQKSHMAALNGSPMQEVEFRFRRKDGSYLWLSSSTDLELDLNGQVRSIVTRSRDITERKNNELQLRGREQQLRKIADSIPGMILKFRLFQKLTKAEVLYISEGVNFVFGTSVEEATANPNLFWEKISQANREDVINQIKKSAHENKKWELIFEVTDSGRWFHCIASPSVESPGEVIFDAVIFDVTESKLAQHALQESEERFKKVSTLAVDYAYSITIEDDQHEYEWIFGAFEQITGYQTNKIQEWGGINDLVHPEDQEIAKKRISNLAKGHATSDTFRIITRDGQVKWIKDIAVPEWDPGSKKLKRILGLAHDVTSLKIADSENQDLINSLKDTLVEKNDLFRELHHRIKNNLQLISSLLFLKSASSDNPYLKEFIQETNLRITSIAKIHEQLLKLQNINTLGIQDYLFDLTHNLLAAYSSGGEPFTIEYDVDDIIMNVDSVLSLGLITNEVVSNTMKYAYPDQKGGPIEISFKEVSEFYIFTISDFGIGLDFEKFKNSGENLGYQLVQLFTRQLNGKLELSTQEGTSYKFILPK